MAQVQVRNDTNELRLLFAVCQALEGTGDLACQVEGVLRCLAGHTAMLWGGIGLGEAGGTSRPEGFWVWPLPASPGAGGENPVGIHRAALERAVAETGQPGAIRRDTLGFLRREGVRAAYKEDIALFCVPLLQDGEVLGVLFADRLFADSVSPEEDVRLMEVVASLVAQALSVRLAFEERHSAVVEENRRLQALLREDFAVGGMVGSSAALKAALGEMTQVAASSATVLIRGESGTGKELAAAAIHANSPRAGRPFIRLNCAALPEGLVESELFGHERGAFTGATGVRKGRFEQADGGTLFLDEVGDLTAMTQAKLLRVLQEKEFERVGGSRTIRVDVRLIAATNRDLEQMVAQGMFRQDLYYRLSVFPVLLPPLRRRQEDIMPLATHFAEQYGRENAREIRSIAPEATRLLTAYSWPGNIRELENVMERAVLLAGERGVIDAAHLPPALRGGGVPACAFPGSAGPAPGTTPCTTLDAALDALERQMLTDALASSRGTMAKAAARLGISERIMGLRMKKHGISYKDYRK